MDKVNVKLVNKEGLQDIMERLEGYEEDAQGVQDLITTAVWAAYGCGYQFESLVDVVAGAWKFAPEVFGGEADD